MSDYSIYQDPAGAELSYDLLRDRILRSMRSVEILHDVSPEFLRTWPNSPYIDPWTPQFAPVDLTASPGHPFRSGSIGDVPEFDLSTDWDRRLESPATDHHRTNESDSDDDTHATPSHVGDNTGSPLTAFQGPSRADTSTQIQKQPTIYPAPTGFETAEEIWERYGLPKESAFIAPAA